MQHPLNITKGQVLCRVQSRNVQGKTEDLHPKSHMHIGYTSVSYYFSVQIQKFDHKRRTRAMFLHLLCGLMVTWLADQSSEKRTLVELEPLKVMIVWVNGMCVQSVGVGTGSSSYKTDDQINVMANHSFQDGRPSIDKQYWCFNSFLTLLWSLLTRQNISTTTLLLTSVSFSTDNLEVRSEIKTEQN